MSPRRDTKLTPKEERVIDLLSTVAVKIMFLAMFVVGGYQIARFIDRIWKYAGYWPVVAFVIIGGVAEGWWVWHKAQKKEAAARQTVEAFE